MKVKSSFLEIVDLKEQNSEVKQDKKIEFKVTKIHKYCLVGVVAFATLVILFKSNGNNEGEKNIAVHQVDKTDEFKGSLYTAVAAVAVLSQPKLVQKKN